MTDDCLPAYEGYERDGDCILKRYPLDGPTLVEFRARDFRRSQGHPHARVGVKVGGVGLAYDVLNLDRMEARQTLARRSLERIGEIEKRAINGALGLWIDDFCLLVWEAHLRLSITEEQAGSDAEPPPLMFFIPGYIMEGGGTIAFAGPGAGKSYLMYAMAVSIDAGDDRLFPGLIPAKVGVVNLERPPQSVNRRIYYVNKALGLDPARKLSVVHAKGRALTDIAEAVRERVERERWEVLMLDSISRASSGQKLAADEVANMIVDVLHGLCPTWLALGHTSWAGMHPDSKGEAHEFGSVMFRAGEDIGLRVLSQALNDGTLGVGLDVVKANDMRKPPLLVLAFEFSDGPNSHLQAIRTSGLTEFPKLIAGKPIDLDDQIYQLLLDEGTLSPSEIAEELNVPKSRSHINEILRRDKRFIFVRKDGKRSVYGIRDRTQD